MKRINRHPDIAEDFRQSYFDRLSIHKPLVRKLNDILYFKAKKLKIINPSNAPFHMDGEPMSVTSELNVQIIEKAFRLIQP